MTKISSFLKQDQEATATFMKTIYAEMGWVPNKEDGLDDLTEFFHLPDQRVFVSL